MNRKSITILLCALFLPMTHCLYAIDKAEQTAWRNEFRAGWGDMLYETAMYHTTNRTNHYRYTGHIFAEYQRSLLTWLSVGIQTDYEQVWWDTRQAWIPDSQPTEKNRCFYNISLLPSVRFTYFFHPYINLYSSIYIRNDHQWRYGARYAETPHCSRSSMGLHANRAQSRVPPLFRDSGDRRTECHDRQELYLYARFKNIHDFCRLQLLNKS